MDAPVSESKVQFMLHYNFPPYCVGETGRVGSPKRREIGHGRLAERAFSAVVPPRARNSLIRARLVSEVPESNGSSRRWLPFAAVRWR